MSEESGSGSSDSEPVEWNVNSRTRRATAGNRLSSLLNQEGAAEDDEVQLLFEEDEDEPDNEFEDKNSDDADAGGDDSSSSSEDEDDPNDELAGERQLQKEERAQRKTQKRKAEQAFMQPKATRPKRVKIAEPADADTPDSAKAAEQKKKKKSERVSWLLNPEDHGAVRTSSRALSMKNKERTKASLKESEAKRKRSMAQSEAIRKRRLEQKGKSMTQEERLAEAVRTEEVNSQSLNHWETMENERLRRERERREALQNRKLEGPFIRWISTRAEWQDDKLVYVGRREPIEEVNEDANEPDNPDDNLDGQADPEPDAQADGHGNETKNAPPTLAEDLHNNNDTDRAQLSAEAAVTGSSVQATEVPSDTAASEIRVSEDQPSEAQPPETQPPDVQPSEVQPSENQPPDIEPPEAQSSDVQDASEKQLADARPDDILDTEMLDPSEEKHSDVQAEDLPPRSGEHHAAEPDKEAKEKAVESAEPQQTETVPKESEQSVETKDSQSAPDTETQAASEQSHTGAGPAEPGPPAQEPVLEKPKITTYSSQQQVSLFNFSEPALSSLDTYRRVLFGWRSSQLSKPVKHAAQLCAVTSHPARYRDPTTGLAYKDIAALRRIKRITQPDGASKPIWSQALGAWVGLEDAARGVPEGFLAPAPALAADGADASETVKQEEAGGEKQ